MHTTFVNLKKDWEVSETFFCVPTLCYTGYEVPGMRDNCNVMGTSIKRGIWQYSVTGSTRLWI